MGQAVAGKYTSEARRVGQLAGYMMLHCRSKEGCMRICIVLVLSLAEGSLPRAGAVHRRQAARCRNRVSAANENLIARTPRSSNLNSRHLLLHACSSSPRAPAGHISRSPQRPLCALASTIAMSTEGALCCCRRPVRLAAIFAPPNHNRRLAVQFTAPSHSG